MKVCIISQDFYPNIGGIAAHALNLSQVLKRNGHEVFVISTRYNSQTSFLDKTPEGVRIYRFLVPNIGKVRGLGFILQAAPFIFFLSVFKRLDVIHWHNLSPDSFIGLCGVAKKHIYTNHTGVYELFLKKRPPILLQLLFLRVSNIICPSQEILEKTKKNWRGSEDKVINISNGVDIDKFKPVLSAEIKRIEKKEILSQLKKDGSYSIIFCPRRLEPKNGVEFLVSAVPIILQQFSDVLVVIAGGDADLAYAKNVRSLSIKTGVEKAVAFIGPVANDKIVKYFHAADIVALPSLEEATSIAGLEAMACGIPLVGSNIGGIPEIIANKETGIIVPPRDSQAVAAAICELLSSPETLDLYGKRARARAELEFSWDTIVGKTEKVYRS